MRSALEAAALVLGLAPFAAGGDMFDQWRLETELGYMHPGGDLGGVFGGGFDAGGTVGHRLGGVVVEAGAHYGSVGYSLARTVVAPACSPVGPGRYLCTDQPTDQRGSRTALTLGLSVPFSQAHGAHTLQVGLGALVEELTVEPSGEGLGTRHGGGAYLKLAGDVVTIGRAAGAGVLLRGAWTSSHGARLGAPSLGASDVWIEANLVLRVGAGASRR